MIYFTTGCIMIQALERCLLIFMDMVNNQIPTFEDKAEALFYFPLWRTWFGLFGPCKLLWNGVVPADNSLEEDANKVPDHVRNYFRYLEAMTGIKGMDYHLIEVMKLVFFLK
jgi:aldehyde:ferredoxin oxidoreductase